MTLFSKIREDIRLGRLFTRRILAITPYPGVVAFIDDTLVTKSQRQWVSDYCRCLQFMYV
jgi:hypothetical protein